MTGAAPLQDDISILSDAELWRRIPPQQWVQDPKVDTGYRPASAAFNQLDFSVVIALECTGGLPMLLKGHEEYGVASFTVGEVRDAGWGVVRVPDVELPGHAHVTGKVTESKRRNLSRTCRMRKLPKLSPQQQVTGRAGRFEVSAP